MTELTLEKRIENLEKMYLMLQDEVDKKLEMLRENNNLFATEIKKLGGFQEDDDFEAIDGAKVMKNSTLLVSRAGATTLAEITAMGMPAILIPSPYVPNNHQYYNAKSLIDKNAALMIEEKDLK